MESCPQWEQHQKMHALSGRDLYKHTAKTVQMEQIEEELKDYPWMIREIERLRELLEHPSSKVTGMYGLDGAMPKGKGQHANSVHREAQQREKHWHRLNQLEAKVARIDSAAEQVGDSRQRTILECLLGGQRMNVIASHLGISRQRLHELKLDLVRFLASEIFGGEGKDVS
jgi:hypothetical protein